MTSRNRERTRAIRERMADTGEPYTLAARRHDEARARNSALNEGFGARPEPAPAAAPVKPASALDLPFVAPARVSTVHVLPVADLIEHEATETCVCGPSVEPVFRDDGSNGWVVRHNALDQREQAERETGQSGRPWWFGRPDEHPK